MFTNMLCFFFAFFGLSLSTQTFQQEISLNTAKIEHILQHGEALIKKSEPLDAAVIEEELEELQRYCQEVFGRVERYYKKLIRLPVQVNVFFLSHAKISAGVRIYCAYLVCPFTVSCFD